MSEHDSDHEGASAEAATRSGAVGAEAAEHLFEEKRRILAAALPDVPFDGWTHQLLLQAVQAAGFDPAMAVRAFPGGVRDLLDFYLREADRHMLAEYARWHEDERQAGRKPKIRACIAKAIRLRLEHQLVHREAIRKALASLALPAHLPLALRGLYRTVDAIWYAVGDQSTDFNFYTKRLILAGVYSAILAYWLEDRSEEQTQSWAFLERRLDDAMSLGRLRKRVEEATGRLPNPRRFLKKRL